MEPASEVNTIEGNCQRLAERSISEAEAALPREPGAPGTLWKDELGRILRVPSEPLKRRWVARDEAVDGFLTWMRESEFTGWYVTADIVEFWRWYAAEHSIVEHSADDIRAALGRCQGISTCRRRTKSLKGPEWAAVRRQARTEKVSLYYISSIEELEDEAKAAMARPVASRKAKTAPKGRTKPGMGDLFREAA